MNVEIFKLTSEEIYFLIKGIHLGIANGLRRIIISEVPTFAIYDVQILKNDSIMINDYIIQRLGLLPIDSNNRFLIKKMPIECNCESHICKDCCIVINIDVISHEHKKKIFLKDLNLSDTELFTKDAFEIPLFVLNRNESFKAQLRIRKGIGHQNARWMPATVVIAKPNPVISIIDSCQDITILHKLVSSCPKKIFHLKKDQSLTIKNQDQCIYCNGCINFLEEEKLPNFIKIEQKQEEFLFQIETAGTMRPDLIFTEALSILKKKVIDIQDSLNQFELLKI